MRNIVISVPFAIIVSVALVALGAVLATAPGTAGLWLSNAVAAVALFVAIVYTGAAIRRRRSRHN
ncbi:hypothetical protein FHW23_001174 [Curtobacterium pusillum]|uniref:Uncharacterized protein n=1 Tax=Curtobacterium pusillum TaxID=69373 RepID=A0AAW3T6S5_9MICO|nr:DUF308 domain-containing protein [Curtobacterium pusillum]MBA8989928.1 hypothetical protein [Curtobacterium pusillum]